MPPPLHTSPLEVQKLEPPTTAVWQQAWPMPPQLKPPGPLLQLPAMQVTCATWALHTAPLMRQRLLTQQPAAPQVLV